MDPSENIGKGFGTFALTQPRAPALVVPGQCTLTYGDLHAQIRSMSEQLRDWGCVPGDIVAGLIADRLVMALACIAVPACATFAPLHPEQTYDAYVRLLGRMRPKIVLLVCDSAHPARRAVVALGLPYADLVSNAGRLAAAVACTQSLTEQTGLPPAHRNASWAYLLGGSGSTGESKLIPITHESMRRNALVLADRFEFTTSDVGCHLIPMHLPQGLRVALMVPLLCGSSVVILQENDADGFFAALSAFGITWVTAGFTLVRHLAECSRNFTDALANSRLRFVRCGSGTLSPESIESVEERLRAPMIAAYTTAETGAISIDPLPPKVRKRGGVGLPVHADVRVVDRAGAPCATGALGEIVVRGPMVFDGYFADPARTEQSFRDGWYRTGDLGRFDSDGYLFIHGRLNDVINRGGETILPAEVDSVLEQTPGVRDGASFALSHPTLGQELCAAVVCAADATLSTAAIRSRLFAVLGRRGVPRQVFFVDALPRTGNGKIKRHELAQQFAKGELRTGSKGAAAAGPLAVALQAIWSALLSADHVGVNDDFFMLGGDSLTGARLLAQVREVFGVALALDALFHECATVNGMAREIEAARLEQAAGQHERTE